MTDTTRTTETPAAFIATVFYLDQSDASQCITVIVQATDGRDAIETAIETAIEMVSGMGDCKRVEGGMLESLDLGDLGAADTQPSATRH